MTGADGFIGSHLASGLVDAGCQVRAMSLYNSFGSSGWLSDLPSRTLEDVEICWGDIRDPGRTRQLMNDVDLVFHLAALVAIPYSYQAPESFVETNVRGTLNVLESARAAGVPKTIVTSTSEVYGTPESVPITTSHRMNAQSPYAATKVAADQLALSYAASFDLNTVVLRPFNTYGPRQSMRAIIPTVLAQMLHGSEKIRLGSLHTRRDFTFVTDTVGGFLAAADAQTLPGEVIQLGTGVSVSIGELVEMCQVITGSSAEIVEEEQRVRPAKSEVQVLLADPAEAKARLNWQAQIGLEEGLRKTAEWIDAHGLAHDVARYHQ